MKKYSVQCEHCQIDMIFHVKCPDDIKIECKKCEQNISLSGKAEFTISDVIPKSRFTVREIEEQPASEDLIIEGYKVFQKLEEGAFGEVLIGEHEATGEKIVFKFLKTVLSDSKQSFLPYFLREAQILSSLEHRYIAKYLGSGNHKNRPYYKMEYIEGTNLQNRIKQGRMPIIDSVKIIYHLADALDYGLKYKLVHRDIKPANIILANNEPSHPKLIDFGLAKCLGEHYEPITKTGNIMGTPFYMSWEQVRDSKNLDHRSDIYSLGATLYHMLAGQPPFAEYASQSPVQMLQLISQNRPKSLATICSDIPPQLITIVEKAMEPTLARRYQTPKELRNDLKKFVLQIKSE